MNIEKINELLAKREQLYIELDHAERPFTPSPLTAGGYELVFKKKNEKKKTKEEIIDGIKLNIYKTQLEASMTAIEFANCVLDVLDRNGYFGYRIDYVNFNNQPKKLETLEDAGKRKDITACMVLTNLDFDNPPEKMRPEYLIVISGKRFADADNIATQTTLRNQKISIFESTNKVAKYMDKFIRPFRLKEEAGADSYHNYGALHGIANGVRYNLGIKFLYALKTESAENMFK